MKTSRRVVGRRKCAGDRVDDEKPRCRALGGGEGQGTDDGNNTCLDGHFRWTKMVRDVTMGMNSNDMSVHVHDG